MTTRTGSGGRLLGISDLHVNHDENRAIVEGLRPKLATDWLIVAGDVADIVADVVWALELLHDRSLGYPREWTAHGLPSPLLRPILPGRENG